jgi:hypothetical protein
MSNIKSFSTRFLCLILGAIMALAAFLVGYEPHAPLRIAVFAFLLVFAAIYLLSSILGRDKWRSRLLGLAPWA